MSLDLMQRELEGITIVTMNGRLVAGSEVTDLRNLFATLVANGKVRIILDLADVSRIDSSGLGVLVEGHSRFEAAKGALKLLNLNERGAQLLILTRLSTLFEIFDEEQSAINSFFPDREVKRFDILEFVKSNEDANENQ